MFYNIIWNALIELQFKFGLSNIKINANINDRDKFGPTGAELRFEW